MSVLSLFFSSFFFAPNTHIHIHTHIHTKHTPSLKENKLSGGEAGSSASLIIHTPLKVIFMVRRDGAEIRKERIQEVIRRVVALLYNHDEIELESTIAMLQYEMGLRPDKIMEYLKIGDQLKRFELDIDQNKIRKIKES